MVIRHKNVDYIVFSLSLFEYTNLTHRKPLIGCISVCDYTYHWFNLDDVIIVDGRLPSFMCMYRRVIDGESLLIFTCDKIFTYGDHFYDDLENNDYDVLKIYFEYINNILQLHGLPIKDLEFIEQYKPESICDKNERQKAIDDELEEYLRIGEQIEKEKNR